MSVERGRERPIAPDLNQLLDLMSVRSAIAGTAPMPVSVPRQAGVPAPAAALDGHWTASSPDGGAAVAEPALPEPAVPEAPPIEAGAAAAAFGAAEEFASADTSAASADGAAAALDELETAAAFETTPLEDTGEVVDDGPLDLEATEIAELEGEAEFTELEPELVTEAEARPDIEAPAGPEEAYTAPTAEAAGATLGDPISSDPEAAALEEPSAVAEPDEAATLTGPVVADDDLETPQPQALEWRQALQREPAPIEPIVQRLPDPVEIVEIADEPAATYDPEPSKQSVELAQPPNEPEPVGQVVEDPRGIELLQPADEALATDAPPLVAVSGNVKIEAINGPRRGAKFLGKSTLAGASGLSCLMDRFDLDAGTPVKLSLIAPRFADQIDIDDAVVLQSAPRDDRKIQVDLDFEQPHEDLERFIERYFSARPASGSGFSLFGRFKR
ncbi:MAG TPA: hypothetical protein VFS62_05195 [Chloroflexota bacterium]|nr:hypothetical protein [Chloroflexota bacterium]